MRFVAKLANTLKWLPSYAEHSMRRRRSPDKSHVIIGLADHFEPPYTGKPGIFRPIEDQVRVLRDWCGRYPALFDEWRDSDGHPFKHTYFYPIEHYHPETLSILAEHCRSGWGEVEIHLHHGLDAPDTAEHTREELERVRDRLVEHGCLSTLGDGSGPRYAFVHGNWALANSSGGQFCGVDEEMQILADTGCYGDFTMPSAPNSSQVSKINSIYECDRPLNRRAAHKSGQTLRVGHPQPKFPLMVQGPLLLHLWRDGRFRPTIETGEIASYAPPSVQRLGLWRRASVCIDGRPEWCFVKLFCHSMAPWDTATLLGEPMSGFLQQLLQAERESGDFQLHFVSAREMVNIALAACDGKAGNPAAYRDYRLRPFHSTADPADAASSEASKSKC